MVILSCRGALASVAAALACILTGTARADITASTMAVGGDHTCAIAKAGEVKCWGANGSGQLGDGTPYRRWKPVTVPIAAGTASAIVAGSSHTCVLTTAGGVKCWGGNLFYGSVGNGSFDDAHSPVDVAGLSSGVTAIASAAAHTCALLAGGELKCWGANSSGQLGDGTTSTRNAPVPSTSAPGPWVAVATGSGHTCGLTGVGGVKCWGSNTQGQLGNNSTTNSLTPVDVSGLSSGVASIAAGESSTCAVMISGPLKCWGRNRYGELGDGSDNANSANWKRLVPTDVVGLSSGVAEVRMGGNHACARTTAGTVKCWGTNQYYGALGNNGSTYSNTVSTTPVDVSYLAGATALFTSFRHNCALVAGGVPRCWGSNENGQLGSGVVRGPARTPHFGIPDYDLSAGISHSLLADTSGRVWAWGDNTAGKLGNGTTANSTVPVRAGELTGVVAVAAGMGHSLALKSDGTVWAWGLNSDGQLGIGASSPSTCTIPSFDVVPCAKTPVQVPGLADVVAVSAGWRHSLALLADGTVWEWGNDNLGSIGPGAGSNVPVQKSVIGFGVRISAGYMHSVALESNGNIYAWGRAERGELSTATTTSTTTPTQAGSAIDISAGGGYTLALGGDGTLTAWGSNVYGMLGDSTVATSDGFGGPGFRAFRGGVPGVADVTAFSAGFGFAVIRKADGSFWSWGLNNRGQLGGAGGIAECGTSGTVTCLRTPTAFPAHDGALVLAAGGAHVIEGRPGGTLVRFGDNSVGQLAGTGGSYGTDFGQTLYDPSFVLTPGGTFGSGGSVGMGSTSDGLKVDGGGLDFGTLLAGSVSSPVSLTLTNLSDATTSITSVLPSGDFIVASGCGSTLAAGASCTIGVRFAPSGVGPRYGSVSIDSSIADSPSIVVSVYGTGVSAPGVPTSVVAVPGSGQATVSFAPPASNGGSAITFYTVTSSPGGLAASGPESPLVVTGLSNGIAYSFSVTATNAYGTSTSSAPSAGVVPKGTTTTVLSSSANPSVAGAAVTLGATVSGGAGTPTGTVAFRDGASAITGCGAIPLSSGLAQCVTSALSAGTRSITAEYSGSSAYLASVSTVLSQAVLARGPAFPDFNTDGKPDIIWSNTASGATYLWRMNGPVLLADSFYATIDPSWKIQGVADFNGDGHPDIVWRNTANGACYVWYTVNGVFTGTDAFLFSLPPEWVIQGVADFNQDGKPDFLMRNSVSGNAFVWYFNNASPIGDQFLFNVDPSWKVEAVGDVNLDGQPDLLFRSMTSGLSFAWNTNYTGGVLSLGTSSPMIYSIDPVWEVVQLADWNADGKPDLLFRNAATGLVFVWYLDGVTLGGSDFVYQIDPSWEIVPRR